ncbi:MAG TPA: hypothetical protein VHB25_06390 [Gemmatimonadaceae bacterium]|nr:hypothetical protein [Gemmatimonadaceae bacterium]
MSTIDETIGGFLASLETTPTLWRSIDIRALAVCVGGQWYNQLTTIKLDPREHESVAQPATVPNSEPLALFQEVRGADELSTLLSEIRTGAHSIAGREIVFRELTEKHELGGHPYGQAHAYLQSRLQAASAVHRPREFIGNTLQIQSSKGGPRPVDFLPGGESAVSANLRSAQHPFDGLDGLARVAMGSGFDPRQQGSPYVEVVAPLGAAIDHEATSLDRGTLKVGVWAESVVAAEQCSVGYVAEFEDRRFTNGSITAPAGGWTDGVPLHGLMVAELGAAARRVTTFLRVGPHTLEWKTVLDTSRDVVNPHVLIHEELDRDLADLRESLQLSEHTSGSKQKHNAPRFEHAVARLFSAAGFHVDLFGSSRGFQHVFDVLARTPDGFTILAVECTLGSLSSGTGKPGRLIGRADDLRNMPALGSHTVLPIMATARRKTAVLKTELDLAAREGMVVLAREHLLDLLDAIQRGAQVSDVLAFCERAIPIVPRENGL